MHRKIIWALALGAVAILAVACQPEPVVETVEVEVTREVAGDTVEVETIVEVTSVPGRCAPTDIADVETIQIGATAPLSAPGSVTGGLVMQAAFRIAEDEINAAGGVLGKPMNLILNDTEGLPERGTAVMERLITQDCVVAVVGEYHSAVGLTMKEVSNKYHMPTIFSETYNDDITGVGYAEVFRIAPTSTFTAQMDAKWLTEVGDYNGDGELFVVIVAENTGYGTGQVDKAETWFPEFGIGLETFFADLPTQDFAPIVARINALATTPDAILIKVTGETSYNLQQQLYEGGIDISQTIVVANQVALNHDEFWQNVPDGNFAVVPRIGPWSSSATETGLAFADAYRARMGRFPEAYAFEAYDALHIMADAINRAGSLDADAIIAALEDTNFVGAAGTYRFPFGSGNTPESAGEPAYMWHQWPEVPLLFLQYTETDQHSDNLEVIWPATYRTSEGAVVRP
jgi:branched-chain amino acid transport system substrate-binding protein